MKIPCRGEVDETRHLKPLAPVGRVYNYISIG